MNFIFAWAESKCIIEGVQDDHQVFSNSLFSDDLPGIVLLHEQINKLK